MPADNNMRRGNHFASGPAQTNGPKRGASPIGGQGFGSQSPDTTQEFMNAHRAARCRRVWGRQQWAVARGMRCDAAIG